MTEYLIILKLKQTLLNGLDYNNQLESLYTSASTNLDELKIKHPDSGETIRQLRLIESAYLAVENKITSCDNKKCTILAQRVGMVLKSLHILNGNT